MYSSQDIQDLNEGLKKAVAAWTEAKKKKEELATRTATNYGCIGYDFKALYAARDIQGYATDAEKDAFSSGWIKAISSILLP